MWKIGLFLFLIGGMLLFGGVSEANVAARASREPERVTVANLIARGPDANPNVIVSHYEPCENYIAKDDWSAVWMPIVPKGTTDDLNNRRRRMRKAKVLVYTTKVTAEAQVVPHFDKPEIRGLVTNGLMGVNGEEEALLREAYPDTDFSTCLILHDGREPMHSQGVWVMKIVGVAIMMTGVLLFMLGVLPNDAESGLVEAKPTPAPKPR